LGRFGRGETNPPGREVEAAVRKLAKARSLSPIEQADLSLNLRSLFTAGLASPERVLPLAIDLSSSTNPMTIQAGLNIFTAARPLVTDEQLPAFERLVSRTYASKAKNLGWRELEGEDPELRLLRSRMWGTVLNLAREPDLDEYARGLTLKWLGDRTSIDPGMAAAITRGIAGKADRETYQALRTGAEELKDITERGLVTRALGWVQNPELAKETPSWILTTTVPANERLVILFGLSFSEETARILWKFLQQNYPAMIERMPEGQMRDRGAMMIDLAAGVCDQTSRQEVQTFFSERIGGLSGGPRALAQTLEKIDLCVARRAALGSHMARYLNGMTP
jgi:alanyl aminopeptidase